LSKSDFLIKRRVVSKECTYADKRLRPLARRRLRTKRPPLVDIR
jgi:hypothetical protein